MARFIINFHMNNGDLPKAINAIVLTQACGTACIAFQNS